MIQTRKMIFKMNSMYKNNNKIFFFIQDKTKFKNMNNLKAKLLENTIRNLMIRIKLILLMSRVKIKTNRPFNFIRIKKIFHNYQKIYL